MSLSPIFSLYVGRLFALAFLAVVAIATGLVLLFDMVELIRQAAMRPQANFALLLAMALLKLPHMVSLLLPFAVMLGGMICFWRLTRSHELVVARSAGLSVWQMLAPALILALLIGTIHVTALNPLSAAMFARYERLLDELSFRQSNPLTVSRGGLWLREAQGEDHMVLHAGQVRQEAGGLHLGEISAFFFDGPDRFSHRIEARTGVLDDGVFDLTGVSILHAGEPARRHETYRLPTSLTLSRIQDNFASPETISFWQLPAFIEFFESAGFSAHRQRLHFQSLLASPFLLCAMVFVAAAFSMRPNLRSGGIVLRLSLGVAAGFLFYFFSELVHAMGLSATLPLALAAWAPAGVTALVGLASLFYLEEG